MRLYNGVYLFQVCFILTYPKLQTQNLSQLRIFGRGTTLISASAVSTVGLKTRNKKIKRKLKNLNLLFRSSKNAKNV